jgi:hypothetical protein
MSDIHKNYLFDLGYLLREEALKAKDAKIAARGTDDEAFQSGHSYAFYEVIASRQRNLFNSRSKIYTSMV